MSRRRGSGEDSIYRDGDRWRGAVSLGYDEHVNRVRKKVSGRTRAEVTEKLRKLHQQVDSGVVPDDRLTVNGMRRGEVLGLHWSALDWKAGTLEVTHGVKRVKDRDASSGRRTRLVVSELKTPKSRRTLSLTPELVARFRQHRARQAEAQMAAGTLWQDHGLIFASEVGTPMDPDNFSHSFVRLCERAGLGHWHPHELRHSGASLMLAQGTPLHVVSEVLGHASIAITKDVYTCSKAISGRQPSR